MTLRDRQKEHRRDSMLDAARELFVDTGYSRTTMDAIAERAAVGVATVYNYFGTKETLFAALARRDMSLLRAEGAEALLNLPEDPIEAVMGLVAIYDKVHDFISFELIRDFQIESKRDGPIRDAGKWMEKWKVEQLEQALEHAQREGRLAPKLAIRDAAEIINELANHYSGRPTTPDPDSTQKAFQQLERWISILFDDWRA